MSWHERIVHDPDILAGKATVRGTRLAVDMIVDHMAAGWSTAELIESYPSLTEEDIRSCLAYAAEAVRAERVFTIDVAG
jgi:uncharacterized protein (DUF433 family)